MPEAHLANAHALELLGITTAASAAMVVGAIYGLPALYTAGTSLVTGTAPGLALFMMTTSGPYLVASTVIAGRVGAYAWHKTGDPVESAWAAMQTAGLLLLNNPSAVINPLASATLKLKDFLRNKLPDLSRVNCWVGGLCFVAGTPVLVPGSSGQAMLLGAGTVEAEGQTRPILYILLGTIVVGIVIMDERGKLWTPKRRRRRLVEDVFGPDWRLPALEDDEAPVMDNDVAAPELVVQASRLPLGNTDGRGTIPAIPDATRRDTGEHSRAEPITITPEAEMNRGFVFEFTPTADPVSVEALTGSYEPSAARRTLPTDPASVEALTGSYKPNATPRTPTADPVPVEALTGSSRMSPVSHSGQSRSHRHGVGGDLSDLRGASGSCQSWSHRHGVGGDLNADSASLPEYGTNGPTSAPNCGFVFEFADEARAAAGVVEDAAVSQRLPAVVTTTRREKPRRCPRMRTIIGVLLAIGLFAQGFWTAAHQSAAKPAPVPATRPASVAIEDIRVGQRVVTDPADLRPHATAVDPATWRRLRIQATLRWDDGTPDVVDVESLLPPEWIAERGAEVGAMVPIPMDLVEMGMPEDLTGMVLINDPCPKLQDGSGRIVLTTIAHPNRDVIELSLQSSDGRIERLCPTAYHKFYSATRNEWVSAIDLRDGELVRGVDGPVTVTGMTRMPGIYRVYNMTVESDHVYRVAQLGVLVHNEKCNATLRKEWEAANKKPWPKDPTTGNNMDVSHEVPKADGGANDLSNITPRPHDEHMQIHIDNGDFVRWGRRGGRP